MDELETCIKREILSIHVKHRERKKETAEKISMTYLRNGIATFKEEDKERFGKIGIPRWVFDGWVGSWESNPFFGGELYARVFIYVISYKSYLTYHLTYSKEALKEARVIIEEAEKILSSPDSEGMTVEEIKEKARNNGYDRMEAVHKRKREAKEKQEQERRQVEQQEARERWEREKKEIELKREEIRKREEMEARIEKKRELMKQQLMEKRHLSTFTGVKNLVRIANGQGKNM